jgi:2-polyprenyl-3-methyl-5-hydroxy-6-metoxy-1,4-benzoquinol methylase
MGEMKNSDGYFEERIAESYDEASADMFSPIVVDTAIDVLAELAGRGKALEFGIGTGRIALPLAARGVSVYGIDLSQPMVARMRANPAVKR